MHLASLLNKQFMIVHTLTTKCKALKNTQRNAKDTVINVDAVGERIYGKFNCWHSILQKKKKNQSLLCAYAPAKHGTKIDDDYYNHKPLMHSFLRCTRLFVRLACDFSYSCGRFRITCVALQTECWFTQIYCTHPFMFALQNSVCRYK